MEKLTLTRALGQSMQLSNYNRIRIKSILYTTLMTMEKSVQSADSWGVKVHAIAN